MDCCVAQEGCEQVLMKTVITYTSFFQQLSGEDVASFQNFQTVKVIETTQINLSKSYIYEFS